MTLFEVLIVVAILALIATGVGVAAYKEWVRAQAEIAESNALALRGVVKTWRMRSGDASCPRFEQLVEDGVLERTSPRRDPWGGAWRIECIDDEVTVSSSGRDRQAGTEDDIRVPPV